MNRFKKFIMAGVAALAMFLGVLAGPTADVAKAQVDPPPTYVQYDYEAVHQNHTHYQIHGYYYYNPWYYILSFENVNAIVHVPEAGDFYRVRWTCQHMISSYYTNHTSPWRLQEQLGSTNYLWFGCPHGYLLARCGFPIGHPCINAVEVA